MKAINWSLIAKKAWETRRKNETGNGVERKSVKVKEVLSDEDKMMMRIFREEYVVGDEWQEKSEREMVKKMQRKTMMERALGVYGKNGIDFGKNDVRKVKIERWSGGVKFGAED